MPESTISPCQGLRIWQLIYERKSTVWKPQFLLLHHEFTLKNLQKIMNAIYQNPHNFDENPDPDLDPACYFDADSTVHLMPVRVWIPASK